MKQSGHICPITGGPLAESDLRAVEELRLRISKWILQRSMHADIEASALSTSSIISQNEDQPPMLAPGKVLGKNSPSGNTATSKKLDNSGLSKSINVNSTTVDDDLYDF